MLKQIEEQEEKLLITIEVSLRRAKSGQTLDRSTKRLAVISKILDALYKKLNKVLPDLKSQEVEGAINHTHYNLSPSDRVAARSIGRHGFRDTTLIPLVVYRHGHRVFEVVALKWGQIDLK